MCTWTEMAGEKWTTVRRRKKPPLWERNLQTTSFFVSGFSDHSKKGDLLRCFEKFGKVVDVFMGTRKDKAGRNFAFIKFGSSCNKRTLECEMQGVECGGKKLAVNLAKYGRNRAPIGGEAPQVKDIERNQVNTGTNAPIARREGVWGGRSFADVINAGQASADTMRSERVPPILLLTGKGKTKNWIDGKVLIGEVLSLDHLAALPSIFVIGDGIIEEVKYVGGLNAAICFKQPEFAKEFLEDSGRWIEWFYWLKQGEDSLVGGERIAWVRIIGLPLSMWEDNNLMAIANRFGKIIVPADELQHRTDASIIRMGVLTKKKSWINEELLINYNGKQSVIGVVEFDHVWSPFSVPNPSNDGSSNSSGDEDDQEGISDTVMGPVEAADVDLEDLEEGEIPRWSGENHAGCTSSGNGLPITHAEGSSSCVHESVDIPMMWRTDIVFNTATKNLNQEKEKTGGSQDFSVSGDKDATTGDPGHMEQPIINTAGPGDFLPWATWFGPFPSFFPGTQSATNQPKFAVGDSAPNSILNSRKRKSRRSVARFNPYLAKGMACPDGDIQNETFSGNSSPITVINSRVQATHVPTSGAQEMDSSSSSVEIDRTAESGMEVGFEIVSSDPMLQSTPVPICGTQETDSSSSSVEIDRTAEVGMEVGFEIESSDPMLAQLIG
ncbi:hypothetical protein LXL04_009081 [Taraxacum kok-saghyz]